MAVVARRRTLAASQIREQVLLLGVKNGINTVFTTPESYLNTPSIVIRVYFNGVRQRSGAGNDFLVSESGGPGMGFNTITMSTAPRSVDQLTADYYADI